MSDRIILKEEDVQRSVVKFLKEKGWGANLVSKKTRSQGVDIKVCGFIC